MIRVWSVTPYTVSVTNKKILEPPNISGITIYKNLEAKIDYNIYS